MSILELAAKFEEKDKTTLDLYFKLVDNNESFYLHINMEKNLTEKSIEV